MDDASGVRYRLQDDCTNRAQNINVAIQNKIQAETEVVHYL